MTIQDILEELIYKQYTNKCESKTQREEDKKYEESIAQAKSAIEEMFGEWIGEDKKHETKEQYEKWGEEYSLIHRHTVETYNQAKQEIRNRVKEGVK